VSDTWQSTYIINTTRLGFRDAEAACQDDGGHLVSYGSLDEQVEVESFFVANGYFIPTAHKFYWMGYRAIVWPQFQWLDPNTYQTYTNWGTYLPDYVAEPNNMFDNEYCVGANATETLPDTPAFGWSDEVCNTPAPFICKVLTAKNYNFVSQSGGNFTLSTLKRTFYDAEAQCNMMGGHLAYYTSLDEQYEVEQYYLAQGMLFYTSPGFYWLGLRSNRTGWPAFTWTNTNQPLPDVAAGGYDHWGVSDTSREPNNEGGSDYCAGANYTQTYDGGWGWDDNGCTFLAPYICRQDGGSLPLQGVPGWGIGACSTLPGIMCHRAPSTAHAGPPCTVACCSAGRVPLHQPHHRQRLPAEHHSCGPALSRGRMRAAGRPPGQLCQLPGAAGGGGGVCVLGRPHPQLPPVLLDGPAGPLLPAVRLDRRHAAGAQQPHLRALGQGRPQPARSMRWGVLPWQLEPGLGLAGCRLQHNSRRHLQGHA
jgi:hypothetical protein